MAMDKESAKAARERFKIAVAENNFCDSALKFAKGKSLPQAWAACRKGGYMAWWLYDHLGPWSATTSGHLKTLAASCGLVGSAWFRPEMGTHAQNRKYANLVRKHYNYDGTRRTTDAA